MESSAEGASRGTTRRRSPHLRAAVEKKEEPAVEKKEEPPQETKKKQSRSPKRLGRSVEESQNPVFREVINFKPTPLPVRNYDKVTTEPVSFYLSSLEELLAWTPGSDDAFNIAMIPLAERQPPLQSQRPRTLLCHDMKGGYLGDRFIQGSMTESPYVFYHWQCIDIFVYFSHYTVTIPPVGWTNAAHKHGVSVLGTFITEWTEGGRLCEKFLSGDPSSYKKVADQLVRIAQFFRFDGWLINIENTLSMAAVGNTPSFLRYLTDQLHQQVPGGLVIWYDSVVKDGKLLWQNELNGNNSVFFESCDGIFTNYNWNEDHLKRMAYSGVRKEDVYIGVDIFARGNVVGGGFDTNKSLDLIRKYGLSAALFAPGWVYECLDNENFFQNQDRFWSLLEQYLPTHSICSLPFVTSFCLGLGTRRFSYGQEETIGPWYHLSAQEIQPLYGNHKQESESGKVRIHSCLMDAWNGGSSVLVHGTIPSSTAKVSVRLFSLKVPAPPKIYLSLIYKLEERPDITVALELSTLDVGRCNIGGISALHGPSNRHTPRPLHVPPARLLKWVGRCNQQFNGGWIHRCYEVTLQNCFLQDIFVSFTRPLGSQEEENFICRLGEIQVVDANSLMTPLYQVRDLTASHTCWHRIHSDVHRFQTKLLLSCTLYWSYLLPHASGFRIYHQGGNYARRKEVLDSEEPTFLGLAHANMYRVVNLEVEEAPAGQDYFVDFLVQPIPKEGFLVPDVEWGRLTLLYSKPSA
ncbi:cytosolic endo-beta-N-acetylglucosaminidase isoform X2 [Dromiciops gliroides]|uniref:cytosolic endo-beta-N-acetylglucosaminidase isoform X2 n=1 Tax=Dromiciops gliroides TaxID=33562 RepID=UPI001CC4D69D|nr:cytosolic endo-beta-N-acetylglucosaminidase isoform X2 [Dromiciops gliroides]